jgi:hypothetical protein
MNLSAIRQNFENYGVAAGLHDVTKRALGKVVPIRVLRTMKLTVGHVDPSFSELPRGYDGQLVQAEIMGTWSSDERNELDESFLRAATERGDRCYVITRGTDLASYGWYSKCPTPMTEDLVFHFDPNWVYMYKGLTLPEYRGQRLHAVGMARSLFAHVESGSAGILSYVESNNFASLRSCYRMGYEDVGTIMAARFPGRTVTARTPGCRTYGLRVEVMP